MPDSPSPNPTPDPAPDCRPPTALNNGVEPTPTNATPESDRVSPLHKLIYGLGGCCFQFGTGTVNHLAQPIYNITLGVNPALIGLVQVIARIWDACTDPFVGTWSDNCRSRFGRRKPFIVAGAIFTGIAFPLMWFVPRSFGGDAAFVYFLITSLVFFTAFTLYVVPYQTLGYELTPDYSERTRLMAIRTLVNQGAALAMPWFYRLTQMDIFGDTITGIRIVSIGTGVLVLCLGMLPGLFLVERYHRLASTQQKRSLRDAIIIPFQCRPFVIVVGIVLLMAIGTQTVEALGIYINIYYVCGGDTKMGATLSGMSGTCMALLSIAASLWFSRLADRFSKHAMLRICLLLAMAASVGKWFLFTPAMPYLQLLMPVLMAPAVAGFWIYTNSMKADICDYDEWHSGKRREGIFGAGSAWIHKTGTSITYLFAGGILLAAGFRQELGGAQSESTLLSIRLFFSLVPLVFLVAAFILLRFYPITDDRAREIRRDLEARRDRV